MRTGDQKNEKHLPQISQEDAYAILGAEFQNQDSAKSAYKKKVLKWHPDKLPPDKVTADDLLAIAAEAVPYYQLALKHYAVELHRAQKEEPADHEIKPNSVYLFVKSGIVMAKFLTPHNRITTLPLTDEQLGNSSVEIRQTLDNPDSALTKPSCVHVTSLVSNFLGQDKSTLLQYADIQYKEFLSIREWISGRTSAAPSFCLTWSSYQQFKRKLTQFLTEKHVDMSALLENDEKRESSGIWKMYFSCMIEEFPYELIHVLPAFMFSPAYFDHLPAILRNISLLIGANRLTLEDLKTATQEELTLLLKVVFPDKAFTDALCKRSVHFHNKERGSSIDAEKNLLTMLRACFPDGNYQAQQCLQVKPVVSFEEEMTNEAFAAKIPSLPADEYFFMRLAVGLNIGDLRCLPSAWSERHRIAWVGPSIPLVVEGLCATAMFRTVVQGQAEKALSYYRHKETTLVQLEAEMIAKRRYVYGNDLMVTAIERDNSRPLNDVFEESVVRLMASIKHFEQQKPVEEQKSTEKPLPPAIAAAHEFRVLMDTKPSVDPSITDPNQIRIAQLHTILHETLEVVKAETAQMLADPTPPCFFQKEKDVFDKPDPALEEEKEVARAAARVRVRERVRKVHVEAIKAEKIAGHRNLVVAILKGILCWLSAAMILPPLISSYVRHGMFGRTATKSNLEDGASNLKSKQRKDEKLLEKAERARAKKQTTLHCN